jgi:hypothetical protein
MSIRNCLESDILKMLGGTDLQCEGTQTEILNDIALVMGGTVTNPDSRNELLEDILSVA